MYGLMENGSAYDPRPRQALPADEGASHRPPPFPTVLALDPTLSLGDLVVSTGRRNTQPNARVKHETIFKVHGVRTGRDLEAMAAAQLDS